MIPELPKTIGTNIEHFTGRTWLLPTLLKWFEGTDERMFILIGGPGTGKSMIMAWLAGAGPMPGDAEARQQLEKLRAWVKAVHFCVAASGTTDPKELARQMAGQLTCSVPGFGQALAAAMGEQVHIATEQHVGRVEKGGSVTGVYIANLSLSGLSEELSFNRILRDPLKRVYEDGFDKPMLLLVDSLDEALTYTGGADIVQMLTKLADLPAKVRILVTTRPDPRVLKFFHGVKPFDLIKDVDPDVDDVRIYADRRLAKTTTVEQGKRQNFATRLANQARGIFLFAAMVLDDLLKRPITEFPDLDTYPLPDGLGGIYHDFLVRELGKDEKLWFELYEPLLGLIAVAQDEGLKEQQLSAIIGKDSRAALWTSKQYLSGELPDGPFRFFHKSFEDFLLEDKDNIHYHVDAPSMHRRIAEYYKKQNEFWDDVEWSQVDDYGMNHLSQHLYALKNIAGRRPELYGLICKSLMREKEARYGSSQSFSNDVALAIEVAAEDESPEGLVQLVRACLIFATLGTQATEVPLEVLGILARGGGFAKALGNADLIEEPRRRIEAYALISEALFVRGKLDEAKQSLSRALAFAESTGNLEMKKELIPVLARVWGGEWLNKAIAIVETIDDAGDRADVLSVVVQILGQNGDEERARKIIDRLLTIAEELREEYIKAAALSAAAQALAHLKDEKRAIQLVGLAVNEVERVKEWNFMNVRALHKVIRVAARLGEQSAIERICAIADNFPSRSYIRDSTGTAIIKALAEWADKDWVNDAIAAAQTIESVRDRADILSEISLAQAKLEDETGLASSLADIEMSSDLRFKAVALGKIAQGMARMKFQEKAKEIAYRALAAVEKIPSDRKRYISGKAEELGVVAQAFVELADKSGLTKALAIAQIIEDEKDRAEALGAIAQALDQIGEWKEAMEVANLVMDVAKTYHEAWPKALAIQAAVQALAQKPDRVKVNRAFALAESIQDDLYKAEALSKVAQALANLGDQEKMIDVVKLAFTASAAIENDRDRQISLKELAHDLAHIDDENIRHQALSVAEELQDANTRVIIMSEVAQGLASAGYREKAIMLASRLLTLAGGLKCELDRAEALCQGAQAFVQARYGEGLAKILEMAETLKEERSRAVVLSRISRSLMQIGENEKATEVRTRAFTAMEMIQDEVARASLIEQIAGDLAYAGGENALNRILAVFDTSNYEYYHISSVLKEVAIALAEAGDKDGLGKVLEVARMIGDEYSLLGTLIEVAIFKAKAGDTEQAQEVASLSIDVAQRLDGWNLDFFLPKIAKILTNLGDNESLNKLYSIARNIGDNCYRARALGEVAQALTETGNLNKGFQAFRIAFSAARFCGRYNVFKVLSNQLRALGATDQWRAFWKLYEVMNEIEGWWSWKQ